MPLFLSWTQLDELAKSGMSIGAHSHSHEQFSNLTPEELKFELDTSKSMLEDNLGITVNALSYPVGAASSFDKNMFELISACGYDLAFSFNSVVNLNVRTNRFQLGRISIDRDFDVAELKERCISAAKL